MAIPAPAPEKGRAYVPPTGRPLAPEPPIRRQVALREVPGSGPRAGIRRRARARGCGGRVRRPAETPNLQPFVTFPWFDSSNGCFTVDGPEAGIYNAGRGLDPR
jgi:hypothetical protein